MIASHSLSMFSPNYLEQNSHSKDFESSQLAFTHRQPIQNPHDRLLTRTVQNCPARLTGRKRTKWLKAGQKAQNNYLLLSTLNPFHWSTSNYDSPIFVHHQTSESHLYGTIHKISNVRLYTIDTEADRPTRQYPHSTPALIQIQAIHDENYSTIIIIEIQHLPPRNTSLFRLIQQLCSVIFSSDNKLMAWGDVYKELHSFEDFNLFNLSQVTNTFDLQKFFTTYWNKTHPHTPECIASHQPAEEEAIPDDTLICLVNSNDIDDDFDPDDPMEDYNTCICPPNIRPYKAKNALWSLQKAVEFTFHQVLDKSLTFNIWSCGLDLSLRTWHTNTDKNTRQSLISYAMNDLFAPTCLYYYINNNHVSSPNLINSVRLNTIQLNQPAKIPSFLILADSHARYFPPITVTPSYKLIVKSISGLQWVNQYNHDLCATSIIFSSSVSSLLSSSTGVFFLVGTNSIRNTLASQIIAQIEHFMDLIRSHYIHLKHRVDIAIALAFPCFNSSYLFTSTSALSLNIQNYNVALKDLALRKKFTVVDLNVTCDQLNRDGMHIHLSYLPSLWNTVQQYFENLIFQKSIRLRQLHNRTRPAKTRRNKRRHQKQKQRQITLTVTRPIARVWKLQDLKTYLRHNNIKYARLPEIRRHILSIQFNNLSHQQHAEQTLTSTDFDESNYYRWTSYEQ